MDVQLRDVGRADAPIIAELANDYEIARKFWGQGVAGSAVALILDVIRNECPDATEVLAQYMEENPASGRVLEKNGFELKGKSQLDYFSIAYGEARPAISMIKRL